MQCHETQYLILLGRLKIMKIQNTDLRELYLINTKNIKNLQREDSYLNNIIKAIENLLISKPI